MTTRVAERARILSLGQLAETPSGLELISISVQCPNGAEHVVSSIRMILLLVLIDDGKEWPSINDWERILPTWFIDQFTPEMSEAELQLWLAEWYKLTMKEKKRREKQEQNNWSLKGWIEWFNPENDERAWQWWDATIIHDNQAIIRIEVFDYPTPIAALEYLIFASGGRNIQVLR